MRRALITGATGGLGRHLAEYLRPRGYDIRASGRNLAAGAALRDGGIDFIPADLTDPGVADALCAGRDVVFHCAALSAPWGRAADFQRINITATQALLDAARRQRVGMFVHVSTPSLYFDFSDRYDLAEDAPLPARFVNAYAATKFAAEGHVLAARGAGLKCCILRPRAIFGVHDRVLLPRLLRVARHGRFPLLRGGAAQIDVTCAENVAQAMWLCDQNRDGADGGVFNISNGTPLSIRALLSQVFEALEMRVRLRPAPWRLLHGVAAGMEAVARLLPGQPEPALTRYSLGVLAFGQTLDIGAARRVLGYAPELSIADGLARFAAAYRRKEA